MSAKDRKLGTVEYERVVESIWPDATLVRVEQLAGGVSAVVTRIDALESHGVVKSCVVRQHGLADLTRNPAIASDEFNLLLFLRQEGLPVPEPLMYEVGSDVPGAPYLVTGFVEGSRLDQSVRDEQVAVEMAAMLTRLHSISASCPELGMLENFSEYALNRVRAEHERATLTQQERSWWNRLATEWNATTKNPKTLLHGDFWPGNLLWNDGSISGLLDWEDAAVGDPLADVANCSLELFIERGESCASLFVREYATRNPVIEWRNLTQWQLLAAARLYSQIPQWDLADEEETEMLARAAAFAENRLPGLDSE